MPNIYHTFYITFWRHFGENKPKQPTQDWLHYRTRLLVERTLRSLTEQTLPTRVLVYVAPDVREAFFTSLDSQNLQLPPNVKVTSTSLQEELVDVRQEHEFLLVTRIDSDDLFHRNVAAEIRDTPNLTHWRLLIYRVGFFYDIHTGKIDRYIHHCPPFYTAVFPRDDATISISNHQRMLAKTDPRRIRLLPAGQFVVLVHGQQDTSTWDKLQQYITANRHKLRASDLVTLPENLGEFGSPDLGIPK